MTVRSLYSDGPHGHQQSLGCGGTTRGLNLELAALCMNTVTWLHSSLPEELQHNINSTFMKRCSISSQC